MLLAPCQYHGPTQNCRHNVIHSMGLIVPRLCGHARRWIQQQRLQRKENHYRGLGSVKKVLGRGGLSLIQKKAAPDSQISWPNAQACSSGILISTPSSMPSLFCAGIQPHQKSHSGTFSSGRCGKGQLSCVEGDNPQEPNASPRINVWAGYHCRHLRVKQPDVQGQ